MASDDPLIGFSTDSVRFERLLGKGAMGAVYRGVQIGLERPVAIKVIASHLAEDADYIARFEREAQTIGKLVHPNVIACHDFGPCTGPAGEKLYLMVLEYVDGWSLGHLAKTRKLTVRQVLELHRQAAEGLNAAHRLGIVHRDIKPDNIMVTKDGNAKLADFGLARQLSDDAQLTQAGSILGSPAFMSPEACKGLEPTPASDIYSLGCSLYQVLAGRPVYAGTSALQVMQEHIASPIPKIAMVRPELAALQPVLNRALAKDPAARYPDAHALAKDLQAATQQIPRELHAGKAMTTQPPAELPTVVTQKRSSVEAPDATVATTASGPRKRRVVVAACATLGLAVLAIAAWPHAQPAARSDAPATTSDPGPTTAAPTTAAVTGPATAPSPTPNAEAPNPADIAALDEAERLIAQNHLADAQQRLDTLVVTGSLKARKRTLMDRLEKAWGAQRQLLVQQLDALDQRVASDPAGVIAALGSTEVPDRFPGLVARRDDLLARARAAAKTAPAPTAWTPSRTNGGTAPAPQPAPTPAPEAPAAGHVTVLASDALGGARCDPGEATAPMLQPLVGFAPRMARHWQDRAAMLVHLPAGTGAEDGFTALIEAGGRPRTIRIDMRALEGADTAPRTVATLTVPANGWHVLSVRLPDRARVRHDIFLSTNDAPDTSFFLGAAAFGEGCAPSWADLKAAPGTLMPGESGDQNALYELARDIHRRRPAFPQYDQVRIGLPDSLFRDNSDRRQRVLDAVESRLLAQPDHPGQHGELTAARTVLEYSTVGSVKFLLDRALGDHDRGNFYIHVLPTAKPPTDNLADLIGRQLKEAVEKGPGLFPVIVLSADGWEGDTRRAWVAFMRGLRTQLPGVAIIDLAQVPIMAARQGQPLDLAAKAGQEAVWLGFEAGLLELRQRLDVAVR